MRLTTTAGCRILLEAIDQLAGIIAGRLGVNPGRLLREDTAPPHGWFQSAAIDAPVTTTVAHGQVGEDPYYTNRSR
jgi:hypothetical protein